MTTSPFDTGNSKPIRRGVLAQALEYLERRGFEYVRPVKDAESTYAHSLRYQGRVLYLVARGAPPFHRREPGPGPGGFNLIPYISTQTWLVAHAAENYAPILVCYWPAEEQNPTWRIFVARDLRRRYAHEMTERGNDNTRLGVRMLNYEWALGIDTHPSRLWVDYDKAMAALKDVKPTQIQIGLPVERETTTDQGELITCPQCEALYSSRIPGDKCPSCGAPRP